MTPAAMTPPVGRSCVGAVLFTDLVGFTEFNDAVGDERAVGVLDRQTAMAHSAIGELDRARIVKELGDGLMIWFATAADGLGAATTLLHDVDRARRDGEFPLAVRMGLHYGSALERGDDVVGQTVNVASRLSDIAGPGELVVSEQVVRAVDGAARPPLRAVGPVTVKGVQEPIWVHRLHL